MPTQKQIKYWNSMKGKIGNGFKKGHKIGVGEKNGIWKGDKVSYAGLHIWVRKWKGKPFGCGICGSQKNIRYHWANIDHKYRRVLDDYMSMCCSCHKKYDVKLKSL